jgi:hypothetical protein
VALGTGAAGAVVALGAVPLGLAPAIAVAELSMLAVCAVTVAVSTRVPSSTAGA